MSKLDAISKDRLDIKKYNSDRIKGSADKPISNHKSNSINKNQWILIVFNIIFLSIISFAFFLDWASIWQMPKVILFIFGSFILLVLSSALWIFGGIKHRVAINLGDILFITAGFGIVIVNLINPNQVAFWGSTFRIFDSGLFIIFLTSFYFILKVYLEKTSLNIIILSFVIVSMAGGLVSAITIYIPSIISTFQFLARLNPTGSFLTESPQELVFLTLLFLNIIFINLIRNNNKALNLILKLLYYFIIIIHIILLIRLPVYSMYILSIVSLFVIGLIHIREVNKNSIEIKNTNPIAIRMSFLYGILIVFLISVALIKPFNGNSKFPEYNLLSIPNIEISLSIANKTIQSNNWLGSGSVIYAWDKFTPEINTPQVSGLSFETLYNELFNIVVRNGLVSCILIILFAIWILGSILRIILIHKTFPLELYPLVIAIVGLFLIPFTAITKILFVLILLLWSNVFVKYFRPVFVFKLDINQTPASISSLFTFLSLFAIAGSALLSINMYNIIRSQKYVVEASQIKDNLDEQVRMLKQAKDISPKYIEYNNIYISSITQLINKRATDLALISQQSENKNIDSEKQKELQNSLDEVQKIIDVYKQNSPNDSRPVYWQMDLYTIINNYGEVKESDYLYNVALGKKLKPNDIAWDLYEAKYYAKQAQKEQELNLDKLNKSKDILNSLLANNQYNVEVYKNYYELLALNNNYKEQITILEKYVELLSLNENKNVFVDQELLYLLGVAYQNNKQYTEALEVYNKLLEAFPNYTNVYFKLGELYESQKKIDLSKQNYQKVLDLDPNAEVVRVKLNQLK